MRTIQNKDLKVYVDKCNKSLVLETGAESRLDAVSIYNLTRQLAFNYCEGSKMQYIEIPNLRTGFYLVKTICNNNSKNIVKVAVP